MNKKKIIRTNVQYMSTIKYLYSGKHLMFQMQIKFSLLLAIASMFEK